MTSYEGQWGGKTGRPYPEMPKGNYVPGIGSQSAKIVAIGEAPGYEEDKKGIPFVGAAGRKLDSLFSESGIERSETYVTNVIKYRPPNNDIKRIAEIGITFDEAVKNLWVEIDTLKSNGGANVLILLGNTPLLAITGRKGITKYRGSLLVARDYKCIPTIHPAFLLWQESKFANDRNQGQAIPEQVIIADLMKAKRESETREVNTIPRRAQIIRSNFELIQFLDSYSNSFDWSIDIETYKGIPICIALAPNPYHSASIPLLSIPGVGGGISLSETELIEIYITLARFLNRPEIKFIGQNLKYDHDKLIAVSRLLGSIAGKLRADTSLMMGVAYTEFPKNLAFMTSLFTNEPFYKDEGREFNPKKDKAERLLEYNCKDTMVTYEIKNKLDKELEEFGVMFNRDLKSFYYDYVNKLHDFYMDIEQEGIDVDLERKKELTTEYSQEIIKRQLDLDALVGHPINVRSPKQMKALLFNELKLPTREDTQEDTIVSLLGNHTEEGSKESQILTSILSLRQLRTNFGYLSSKEDYDGRMRTTYRITGTETGRSSTGILDSPIRPYKAGMAFQLIPKHGPFAKRISSIFISPPGYVFLQADYSQAEARIVALLADDDFTLNLFNTSDIHSVTASWIFGIDPSLITPDQRFIGKVVRHAGNYGMGKRRLMLSVNSDAKKFGISVQLSEKRGGEILNIFHARTPRIRSIFQTEVKSEVSRSRTLFNPFGRMRQFFGTPKDEELYAQIPQSTVPDSLRLAGLRIKARIPSIRICAEQHDALLFKIPEEKIEEQSRVIREELEKEINFSKCSLPRGLLKIPVEIKVGKRYSELKKLG